MECFTKDMKAFQELSDESNTDKDFSKFSKLQIPNIVSTRLNLKVLFCKENNICREGGEADCSSTDTRYRERGLGSVGGAGE